MSRRCGQRRTSLKERYLFLIPIGLAFLFSVIFVFGNEPVLGRLFFSSYMSILVVFVLAMSYAIVVLALSFVVKKNVNGAIDSIDGIHLIAAVTLAVLLWMWLQNGKASTIDRIVRCAKNYSYEVAERSDIAPLVEWCAEEYEANE